MPTHSFLLLGLPQRTTRPSNDHRVNRVRAHGEYKTSHISRGGVGSWRRRSHDESDDRYEETGSDVPRALVHAAGAPARHYACYAGEEEGRAG